MGWGQGRDAGAGTHPWALAPIWGGGGGRGGLSPIHSKRSVSCALGLSPVPGVLTLVLRWLSPIL